MPRWLAVVAIFFLLVPSARFAWTNRDMPEFGYLHDDGIFFESAKSIAQGGGHRIPSLPENPFQSKYPPLWPALLSLVWLAAPTFPGNLVGATLLCWLVFAAFLILCRASLARLDLSDRSRWVALGLFAVNPYLVLFGTTPFSEVFFSCLILGCLLLAERRGLGMAAAAGVIGGLAYLTRTAGVTLLAIPLWWAIRKDLRRAVAFVVGFAPFFVHWTLTVGSNRLATSDPTLIYYTDYLRYQFLNVSFDNIGLVLWKNADQLLYSMGALFLPKFVENLPLKMLTQVIGVASVSGLVRLWKRDSARNYILYAAASSILLLIWHFPPNERLILPLFPLLVVGLMSELEHFVEMLRGAAQHKDPSQRTAAKIMTALAALVGVAAVGMQLYMTFWFLDESAAQKRAKLADLKGGYSWISSNLPAGAKVMSYDDPLMYLYTGRQGNSLPLPTRFWYADDDESMIAAYRNIGAYCKARGYEYLYYTTDDPSREVGDDTREKIAAAVAKSQDLTPVFKSGIGTVYRVH